jgi:hypothetical protein
MTSAVSGHAALTCPTICAINFEPAAEPPARKPGTSAGYWIPWTATLAAPPIIFPTALTKGGPATVPMFPVSVVPRAKRTVIALQPLPCVTSFWVEEVSAARVAVGRRRKERDFMVVDGVVFVPSRKCDLILQGRTGEMMDCWDRKEEMEVTDAVQRNVRHNHILITSPSAVNN